MLQYVLVKDLQTGSSYYFLVEEWLSVDKERTDGRVEIEVEASGKNFPSVGKYWLMDDGGLFTWLLTLSFRGGRACKAPTPPEIRAAEGAVRESPVAVAVGETPPQPLHAPAESHLLRRVTAALRVGQHPVVQHRGGPQIRVSRFSLL